MRYSSSIFPTSGCNVFILGPRAFLIYAGIPRSEERDDAILCMLEFHVYIVK